VAALEALTDPARGVGTSVGIFRGGTARQVVPAEAEIHLDLRATDQAGSEWLLTEVRRVAQTPPTDPRVRISVEGGFYRPPFPTRASTQSLYAMAQRVGAAIGTPVEEVVSPGGSDGSFAAAIGIATLDGLGPICHESCSRRERVEVSSIVPRGALFAGLVQAIGSEGVS
jgi:glutamate carboxypeptidase